MWVIIPNIPNIDDDFNMGKITANAKIRPAPVVSSWIGIWRTSAWRLNE
jgi:hypothetical protein